MCLCIEVLTQRHSNKFVAMIYFKKITGDFFFVLDKIFIKY